MLWGWDDFWYWTTIALLAAACFFSCRALWLEHRKERRALDRQPPKKLPVFVRIALWATILTTVGGGITTTSSSIRDYQQTKDTRQVQAGLQTSIARVEMLVDSLGAMQRGVRHQRIEFAQNADLTFARLEKVNDDVRTTMERIGQVQVGVGASIRSLQQLNDPFSVLSVEYVLGFPMDSAHWDIVKRVRRDLSREFYVDSLNQFYGKNLVLDFGIASHVIVPAAYADPMDDGYFTPTAYLSLVDPNTHERLMEVRLDPPVLSPMRMMAFHNDTLYMYFNHSLATMQVMYKDNRTFLSDELDKCDVLFGLRIGVWMQKENTIAKFYDWSQPPFLFGGVLLRSGTANKVNAYAIPRGKFCTSYVGVTNIADMTRFYYAKNAKGSLKEQFVDAMSLQASPVDGLPTAVVMDHYPLTNPCSTEEDPSWLLPKVSSR